MKDIDSKTKDKGKYEIEATLGRDIRKLERRMADFVDFKQTFLRGLINGVATAIGATIIFGLIITILGRLVTGVEDVPILNDIIQQLELRETVAPRNGQN